LLAIASWPVAVPTIASDIGACSESAISLATKESRRPELIGGGAHDRNRPHEGT
jgi:hypothetical protein